MTGGTGNDTLYGLAGDDTLDGGEGNDILEGGDDLDVASYKSAPAAVTINLNDVGQRDTLGAGLDTLVSIEGVEGSDYDDTLRGPDTESNNILRGGIGNDLLLDGLGNDTLDGGEGVDTVSYVHLDNADEKGVFINLWSPCRCRRGAPDSTG